MDDGIYKVVFPSDIILGDAEEMTVLAYNDREPFNWDNRAYRYLSSIPLTNHADFIRRSLENVNPPCQSQLVAALDGVANLHNYLAYGFGISANTIYETKAGSAYNGTGLGEIDTDDAYWSQSNDAECLFGFTNPGGSGTITKISIYALVIGTAKTKFRTPAGVITYGTETAKENLYQWIHKDYESAWAWSDIDSIKAGVWLGCDSGKCRSIKLRVTCADGSTTDVYPSSTYSSSYVRKIFGNPFLNPSQNALFYDATFLYGYDTDPEFYTTHRRFSSDFSHFPPSKSQINSIKVDYSFCGKDGYHEFAMYTQKGVLLNAYTLHTPGTKIRPFLIVDGTYYYGTEYAIGDDLDNLTSRSYTWTTNPATSASWTYHEAQGVRYGIELYRPERSGSNAYYAIVRAYALSATINFNRPISQKPTYEKLGVLNEDTIELTRYYQSPIQADDLTFRLPRSHFLADRTELALVKDGVIVWRGLSWNSYENENHNEVIVDAKSQQIVLDYRIFPGIKYSPDNKEFTSFYNLNDILSDGAPAYPAWSYPRGDEDHRIGHDIDCPIGVFDIFSLRVGTNNYFLGLFFILNSYFFDSYRTVADLLDREIFSAETTNFHEDIDTYSIEGCESGYGGYDVYYPPPENVVSSGETRGGLYRLAWRSNPATVARGEFSISGDTLYTQSPPHSTLILCDHLLDTHIRPGTNDLGEYHILSAFDIDGIAATFFSDLAEKLGQEIRYRYEWDGLVYQDMAAQIANGSEDNPLVAFVNGRQDCHIEKTIPHDPNPNATVGLGTNPKVSSTWDRSPQWFSKIYRNSLEGDDQKAYLAQQIDSESDSYEIEVLREYWHLRPGDWISAEFSGDGPKAVRVKEIIISHGKTKITAGKNLVSLNGQFGVLRKRGVSDSFRSEIRNTEIAESNTLATSTNFTVAASDLTDGWQCKVSLSWDFVMKWVLYGAGKNEGDYDILKSNTSPYPDNAYVQIWGDTYEEYGPHEYEFYITRNMQAVGVEPYGENDVEVLQTGKFKWRKDGGAWSAELEGFDVWHETTEYVDLGNGLKGRVIFTIPNVTPWVKPKSTNILGKTGYAWACATIDLSEYHKFVIMKIGGKVVPPGRLAAVQSSGSIDVDVTEYCNAAGAYTLTTELKNGLSASASPQYYHTLTGSIKQTRYVVPIEVDE